MSTPDIPQLADLLHETADRHEQFEAVAPQHNWWDWYAAYMHSRLEGRTPDESSAAAGDYMRATFGIAPRGTETSRQILP